MTVTRKPNPNVSNALLKALTAPSGKPSAISTKEWTEIKKAAVAELKNSAKPSATLAAVKASLAMGDKLTKGKYASQFDTLVTSLAGTAQKREAALKQIDAGHWPGGGRSTGISTGPAPQPRPPRGSGLITSGRGGSTPVKPPRGTGIVTTRPRPASSTPRPRRNTGITTTR